MSGEKPRTGHYIYLGAGPGRRRWSLPDSRRVIDVGHFGARTCYVRVLERALSWSVDSGTMRRTSSVWLKRRESQHSTMVESGEQELAVVVARVNTG